jgi:hypothetical protein
VDSRAAVGLGEGFGTSVETFGDRRNKAIPPRWHCLDISVSRGAVAEGFPQDRHAAIENPFLDEAVWPNLL